MKGSLFFAGWGVGVGGEPSLSFFLGGGRGGRVGDRGKPLLSSYLRSLPPPLLLKLLRFGSKRKGAFRFQLVMG